jgi:hypothetical protein
MYEYNNDDRKWKMKIMADNEIIILIWKWE